MYKMGRKFRRSNVFPVYEKNTKKKNVHSKSNIKGCRNTYKHVVLLLKWYTYSFHWWNKYNSFVFVYFYLNLDVIANSQCWNILLKLINNSWANRSIGQAFCGVHEFGNPSKNLNFESVIKKLDNKRLRQ
jgi:hypothetical protein